MISKNENELFKAMISIDSIKECKNFIYDLCTPSEIKEFSTRWLIVRLLSKKIPYRQIANETGVSTTTVGRVARFVKYGHNGYNLVLKKLYLDQK